LGHELQKATESQRGNGIAVGKAKRPKGQKAKRPKGQKAKRPKGQKAKRPKGQKGQMKEKKLKLKCLQFELFGWQKNELINLSGMNILFLLFLFPLRLISWCLDIQLNDTKHNGTQYI
jgi:hypothetical protein